MSFGRVDGVRHTDETVYDADGNKTSMTSVFMDGGTKTYEYTCDEHGNELTSKLVENKLPEGVELGTQTEEMSTEWVQVKDPAPFLEMNDRYLMWL